MRTVPRIRCPSICDVDGCWLVVVTCPVRDSGHILNSISSNEKFNLVYRNTFSDFLACTITSDVELLFMSMSEVLVFGLSGASVLMSCSNSNSRLVFPTLVRCAPI